MSKFGIVGLEKYWFRIPEDEVLSTKQKCLPKWEGSCAVACIIVDSTRPDLTALVVCQLSAGHQVLTLRL